MKTLFDIDDTVRITPRDYQLEAHDECFRLWDQGQRGALIRIFTGGGKTITSALLMNTWLQRGDDYRCMVISYEKQLVWQFAQEIEDVLGKTPGIEMEKETITAGYIPQIVVASRQTLQPLPAATPEQIIDLAEHGIVDLGALTRRKAQTYLKMLTEGIDDALIRYDLDAFNSQPEANDETFARVHKFDPSLNWLLIWDEAHKHVHSHKSVGYTVDWFQQNAHSRQVGCTATPKRFDGKTLANRFPTVSRRCDAIAYCWIGTPAWLVALNTDSLVCSSSKLPTSRPS